MKIINSLICISCVGLLLASCSTSTKQKGLTTGLQMQQILSNAKTKNAQLMKNERSHVPANISKDLMPTLSVGKQQASSATNERFDIAVKDMDARVFFSSLVKGTPYNMVISPKVKGKITLHLKQVTIPDVLNAVQAIYGYDFKQTDYGYQVFPAQLQTRMFTVNYLNVKRSGASTTFISSGQFSANAGGDHGVSSGSSGNKSSTSGSSLLGSLTGSNSSSSSGSDGENNIAVAPTSTVNTSSYSDFWKSLKDTLKLIVGDSKGHEVVINPGAGIVIVRGSPSQLNQVASYLDQLQSTMTRQVIIDAKILEVTLNKGYQAGIDWTALGMSQSGNSLSPTATQTGVDDALESFSSIFSLAMSSGKNFSTLIKLLSTQGQVQVLSSPRIATLNNQKAVIKVGQDEFFITDVDNSTVADGSATNTSQGVQLTPFFSGIALGVTPQISGNGAITLHIHPIVSKVKDQEKTFTIGGKSDSLPLALSTVRESDSIVHAKDGQIVVIGGLMESRMEEHLASTPFLGKIPFVGAAFRRTVQSLTKTELVILLRPIVVNAQTNQNQIEQAGKSMRSMRNGFHFGSHPEAFGNMGETSYFNNKKSES